MRTHNRSRTPSASLLTRGAAALVVVVALAACSSGGGDEAAVTTTAAPSTTSSGLGEPVAGSVEAMPVPSIAVLQPDSDAQYATYVLPAGISVEAIDDWYKTQLPDGEPFGSWTWCRTELIAAQIDRIYHHPGTNEILGLTISKNDPEDGDQAFISLGRDESGPANC